MMLERISEKILRLQNGPLHLLPAVALSAKLSWQRKTPHLFYRDRDGDWVNWQTGFTSYNRALTTCSNDEIATVVGEIFQHRGLQRGDVFVDIGAGVGDQLPLMSRQVGAAGRILAIEADPKSYRCLEKVISANQLSNVIPVNLAVSDREGTVTLSQEDAHVGNFTGAEHGVEVTATTLDRILEDHGITRPTCVKINIEGAEIDCLKGAPKTLAAVDHWIVCCHDFLADEGKGEGFRTLAPCLAIFQQAGMHTTRPATGNPWTRHQFYAERRR